MLPATIVGTDSLITVFGSHWSAIVRQFENVKTQAAAGMDKMHTPYGDWCPPPTKVTRYLDPVTLQQLADGVLFVGSRRCWWAVL